MVRNIGKGLGVMILAFSMLGLVAPAYGWHITSITVDCFERTITIQYGGWRSNPLRFVIENTDTATVVYDNPNVPNPNNGEHTLDIGLLPNGNYELTITGADGSEPDGKRRTFTVDCAVDDVPEFGLELPLLLSMAAVPLLLLRSKRLVKIPV